MEFRRVLPADVEAVADFAIQGLRPNLYPLHVSREKVRAMIAHFGQSRIDFNLGAFEDGKPVGIVAVLVSELPWFERREACIVALYATRPGVGWKLLREVFAWYRAEPLLRRLTWPLEFDVAPRMLKIAERYGFNSSNVNMTHYKV